MDARALTRPYSDSHLRALTYRSPVRVVKYSWRCSHCRLRISKLEETPGGRKRCDPRITGGWQMCGSVCFYNDSHRYGIKLLQGDFYKHTHFCAYTLHGSMFTCIIVIQLSDSCSAKWLSCSGSCLCHLWALMRPRQERRVQPNEAVVTADEHCLLGENNDSN